MTVPQAEASIPRVPETSRRTTMTGGTVTFLDVLGWKGIWLRRDSQDVVTQLRKLVETAQKVVRGANDTTVLSISDTIVLLTPGDPSSGLKLHGEVAVELLCESILVGLPLRGATACGEFFLEKPSILVGAAIDEAASWHEATDWIGVIQTPSAFMVHDGAGPWRSETPPVKGGAIRAYRVPCADWPTFWRKSGYDRQALQAGFAAMGPFDPVVATKYTNTLLFYGEDSEGKQSK